MPRILSQEKESEIQSLLRNGLSPSAISRRLRCSRSTVRRVRSGKTVEHIGDQQRNPRSVATYLCLQCSQAAGRRVLVTLKPCVACAARAARKGR